MTPDELAAMSTEDVFDYLRMNTDYALAAVIDEAEKRWLLSSSAAKLWFAHTAVDIDEERRRLDRRAVHAEHNVD